MMNTKDFSSEEIRFRAVWSYCRIPPRLAAASFETYKPTCPEQERALEKCRAFAGNGLDNIDQGKGLFIKGPVGTGKSHLSVSILRAIIQNHSEYFGTTASEPAYIGEPVYEGYCCSMVSLVDLLGLLRESFRAEQLRAPAHRLLRRARSDVLVILDDIGAEKSSDWVEEQLYALIDARYRMLRSTIFTTNCTMKQLEAQIGSRSVSRIMEMCEGVKVGGEDWRKR
ncbi:MAG TPA: ATP-binding protein [Syntrophomonadaceae bacterium]|nr:ATP-binding protein [Syntrophomonadaceae bacterium]